MVLFCLAVVSVEEMEEEEIDFGVEAEGVIKDVEFSVESISVSSKLPATKQCVYLNLVTKEKRIFCVELSVQGFRVVGSRFDECSETSTPFYETIYSLLDTLSPGYRKSFGEALVRKLSRLQEAEVVEFNQDSNLQQPTES